MSESESPRARIADAIRRGDHTAAYALLRELWQRDSSVATASYITARAAELEPHLALRACRLAVMRSFTVEPMLPLLKAGAFAAGLQLDVHVSAFNAYTQEVLDPTSPLWTFAPDVAIVAIHTRDVVPRLWSEFADLSTDDVDAMIAGALADYRGLVEQIRARSRCHIVLHGFEAPAVVSLGILDAQMELGQHEAIRRLNSGLRDIARATPGVYVLDYDALVAQHGRLEWHDEARWTSVRLPIAAACLPHLAKEWLKFVYAVHGRPYKVLVTDLDNTLWGGVIGEDGVDGVALGPEGAGAPYYALQRAMLDLYRRGILLAVCSKNNPDDALAAIDGHPSMLLRRDMFAALRMNWQDKATNLREIAQELNVGIDSLVFVDDNSVERQWIRQQLPDVHLIELPDDPAGYADAVRDSFVFARVALSAEDRDRGRMYAEQRSRRELENAAGSLEEFYRSLAMQVEFVSVEPSTVPRIAQLTQKTNQFNLTGRRYTEQDIVARAGDAASRVYAARVKDRFGDNGIVGVAVVRHDADAAEIESFLMSCRVIGRTVETAFLARIASDARSSGARRLVGRFRPTAKNAPARDVYRTHGFQCTAEGEVESAWELDLGAADIASPPWITVRDFVR